jgi:hypothetical protein
VQLEPGGPVSATLATPAVISCVLDALEVSTACAPTPTMPSPPIPNAHAAAMPRMPVIDLQPL